MKLLLLGAGAQGKATLYDLLQNPKVQQVVVVENNLEQLTEFLKRWDDPRIVVVQADANNREEMLGLMKQADLVIDLLPTMFRKTIMELVIEAKVHLLNTSFQSHIEELDNNAKMAGVMIMPESGLDPGIDLILAGHAIKQFDVVEEFTSACGGVPVLEHADNPLKYKISWIFEGVLNAYKRPANVIEGGRVVDIPGDKIFDYSTEVEIAGLGKMDRYPNGKASTYAKLLGIPDVQKMGRYTLRWPGHSRFWKKIVALGFIDEEPVLGISPKQYMANLLGPKLRYQDHEKDMIILRNEFVGVKDGRLRKVVQQVVDMRDPETGFMAMNRTVGFTASIIAQMMVEGKVSGSGVLNPGKDVPYDDFIVELRKRGIQVQEKVM
ncbi:saccharopine dehydrogenase family protein [Nanoarchaeota archaeon]